LTFADPALRRRAFGIYGAVTGAGGALGLIAGGVLTDAFSWRATMFVSVPFAIVAAVGALWLLPGARNTSKRQWNVRGAGLVVLGIGALLLTITRIGAKGAPLVGVIAGIVAVVCLSLFARAERTSANPVIPHGFFRSRDRSLGLLTVGVGALSMTGVFVILSVHMQGEMGLSALDTSIATLPYPVGMVVSTQLAPRLIGRFGAQRTAVTAMLVAASGLAPLAWSGTHSYWSLMLPSLIFVSLAIGPAFVAGSQLAMSDVAAETSGVAGALMNSASEIGGAIGVAALSAASLSSLSLRPDAGSPGFGLAVLLATAFLLMGGMLGGVLNRRAPRLAR
ncbi:MAG: MFS transporter, partial [Microbacteriaceae bacterium]